VDIVTNLLRSRPARHSRLLGLGAYRPRREVSNAEVCGHIDSSPEWIERRSGITSRRFADPDETLLVMAIAASGKALAAAGITAAQLDCVVLASMSNLVQTPPLSIAVAHELGARRAGGLDVSAACAGFCHALAVASDMVCTGNAEHVLVVGVERMTDIIDPADRGVAFLFGDGAGAVVVGPSETPGIGAVVRGADGDFLDALRMNTSWQEFRADPSREPPVMRMDGRRVFRWAMTAMVPACRDALRLAGLDVTELAAFIPHQANLRMIDVLAAKLGLPARVAIARDVITSGNTSAASIPLAMERLLHSGAVTAGEPALLMGFGAGLNYAGQVALLPTGVHR
jgi:3-oxoacyl-(acyl-carrier-protein) synthase III